MRNLVITGLPFNVPELEDVTDSLTRHKTKIYSLRDPGAIDTIIIHHMASEAPLENQAKYHVNGKDWPGLGYHLVVDTDRLKQANDLLAESYHSKGWNDRAISISVRGNLSQRNMTDIERDLVYAAILTVKAHFNITRILGHNEASKEADLPGTSCPCTSMDRIRADIETLQMKMKQATTWKGKMAEVGNYFNQINYMSERIKLGEADGNAQWAMNNLMEQIASFKAKKLL